MNFRMLVAAGVAALLLCVPVALASETVEAVEDDAASVTYSELLSWLLTGLFAGTFVGWLVIRKKGGLGRFKNIVLGLAGALLGGYLFDVFGVDLEIGFVVIEYTEVVAVLAGSLLILFLVLWLSPRASREPEDGR